MAILVWSFNREFFFLNGILKFKHPYFLYTAIFSKTFIKSVMLRAIVARGQICRLMKTVSKIVGLKIYFCSNFYPKTCVSDKKIIYCAEYISRRSKRKNSHRKMSEN